MCTGTVSNPGPIASIPLPAAPTFNPTDTPNTPPASATSPGAIAGGEAVSNPLGDMLPPETRPTGETGAPIPGLDPVAAPNAAPTPNFADPNPQETAAMKRKKLAAYRYGLAQTIRTSPLGLSGAASVAAPAASTGLGIKTKLGQ